MDAVDGVFTATLPTTPIEFRFGDGNRLDYIAGIVRDNGLASYESPLPGLVAWLVRRSNGYMLDVGANTGLFSLLAAAAHPHIKVCAFEPLESVRTLLRHNIELNHKLSKQISIYPIGLSNAAGCFDFYETINDQGLVTTSSSLEVRHAEQIGAYRKQVIVTETMDSWAGQLASGKIDFIKIDVEGHEYAVIEGGRKTIARNRPFLTVEVLENSSTDSLNKMIFEENYLNFVIEAQALCNFASISYHPDGWNHLLCPAENVASILEACRGLNLRLDIG